VVYLAASRNQDVQQYINNDVMGHEEGAILRCDVNGEGLTVMLATDSELRGLVVDGDGELTVC
jgi:hypothetical protein